MGWSAGGVPRFFVHIAYPDSVSFYFCGFVFSAKVWCPKKRRFRRRCHPLFLFLSGRSSMHIWADVSSVFNLNMFV